MMLFVMRMERLGSTSAIGNGRKGGRELERHMGRCFRGKNGGRGAESEKNWNCGERRVFGMRAGCYVGAGPSFLRIN